MKDKPIEIKQEYLLTLIGMKEVELTLYRERINTLSNDLQKAEAKIADMLKSSGDI